MSSIVITPKNESEFEFLSSLLKRMNIEVNILSDDLIDDFEDFRLGLLMKQVDKTEKTSRENIMKTLGKV